MKIPKGKHLGSVKVGERGQIVLPKDARELFGIKAGDTLLVLSDIEKGIAILPARFYQAWTEKGLGAILNEPKVEE